MQEASQALFHLKNEQNNQIISAKLNEYISRAEHLKKQLNSQQNQATNSPKFKTEQQVLFINLISNNSI